MNISKIIDKKLLYKFILNKNRKLLTAIGNKYFVGKKSDKIQSMHSIKINKNRSKFKNN